MCPATIAAMDVNHTNRASTMPISTWNRHHTKTYVTAPGKAEVRVIDTTRNPFRMKMIDLPDCQVGENVVISD